ncbi:MAG: DinB family protein [Planctomycetota bacterium]|nr:DinB family protein [Planctomycetota bacterium]
MTLAASLVTDFKADLERTKKMIAAIPADKLDWQPHAKSMTLGGLAGHIAESPAWACAMMEDEMDMGAADWKPFAPASLQEIQAKVEECAGACLGALVGKDDGFMTATWTMKNGDQVMIAEPRHQAMRGVLLTHQAHHRGQLSVYLRLLDVPVPATYGPSADDAGGF